MRKLNVTEMKNIKAGSLSGTLINAFVKGFSTFSDFGRYVGSSVRRFISRNLCGL